MWALIWYRCAAIARAQRQVPPLVVFLVGTAALTSNSTGPLADDYGLSAAVLFLTAAWFTIAMLAGDHDAERAIVMVNGGGFGRVLAADVAAAVLCCLLALPLGMVIPIIDGTHTVSLATVSAGALAAFCAAVCGVALGLPCSRLLVQRPAASFILASTLAAVAIIVPWASPVHSMLLQMSQARQPEQLVEGVTRLSIVAVALLAVTAALTGLLGERRAA